jgi:hypothetical protein
MLLLLGIAPSDNLSFIKRISVGWYFWELNPEVLVSLWLNASAIWRGGGSLRLRPPWLEKRAVPLLNYTLAFALQLRKSTDLSQGSRVPPGLPVAPTLAIFSRTASAGLLHVNPPRLPGGLQSALGRHRCLPRCRTKGFPASANWSRNSQSVL